MAQSPFRSIRQTLFNEGKLLRYLGYAIGEIALIIIGIMLALQLNNWNEDRKAQIEFEIYVDQLEADVRTAIANVETSKARMEGFRERVSYIPIFLEQTEYNDEDLNSFEEGLSALGLSNKPQINVGLLGQLLDGKTDTISRDPTLTQKALELECAIEGNLDNIDRRSNQLELIAANRLNHFRAQGSVSYKIPPKYDLEYLKSSNEFRYSVQSIEVGILIILNFDDSIIMALREFLTTLEE